MVIGMPVYEVLNNKTIEKLANRKNAKKIAVENFLGTINSEMTEGDCYANLSLDTKLYEWNSATVNAIRRGINLLFKPK